MSTLFSKRSAHENHPNFLKSLGHRPQPRVILILSKQCLTNFAWPGSGSVTRGHQENWMKSMCTSFGEECTLNMRFGESFVSTEKTAHWNVLVLYINIAFNMQNKIQRKYVVQHNVYFCQIQKYFGVRVKI